MVLKPALQALLWSVFVFPGIGHFHLKRPRLGMVYAGLTMLCLSLLTVRYFQLVNQVASAATLDAQIDIFRILRLTLHACVQDTFMQYTLWALGAVWLLSSLDAYRIGRHHKLPTP